ncbi:hypothetical protein C8Q76DRAFT_733713 [Earliella scabrosa]|nr:hypothetical protein C8Q76DRAFT_733713 [Earliella scabrosa]
MSSSSSDSAATSLTSSPSPSDSASNSLTTGSFTPTPTSNSTLTPSTTTTDASATSTNPTTGLGPPSSSLYLFTFLATLFLLLAISSAIIMRGIFLRRRFRRRLEEAIAAGVLLSPSDDGTGGFGSRSPRRKLQRPTLFDVSVMPPYFSTSTIQDGSWEKLMPFAGNVAAEKPGTEPQPGSDAAQGSPPPRRGHRPTARALLERAGYLLPRARLRRSPTAPPPPSDSRVADIAGAEIPLEQRQDPVQRAGEVRVAVVIAMPNPHRSGYVPPAVDAEMHHPSSPAGKGKGRGFDGCGWSEDADEEGVPDVVFGTARVPLVSPPGEDGEERQA